MSRINQFIFIFLSLSLLSSAYALSEDKKEKLYIVSDSSIYNYKTGINIFEGNVKADQGTTHITSDKLVTKTNSEHKIQEAIAYGVKQQAHYWTTPNLNDPVTNANAMIIKYYPLDGNITLQENVVVSQGENNFQGQLILYNMNSQTITVPASKTGKAVLVYNPDDNSKS